MRVLVDSSIWILFFKGDDRASSLLGLLKKGEAVVNEIILTELLPFMEFHKQYNQKELLSKIPKIPFSPDWEKIRFRQYENKVRGINGVGIPDLIIFHQAQEENIPLWTQDKHFSLMNADNSILFY